MTPAAMEDLYNGMEDMGNFMHSVSAPFPTVARAIGIPPCRPPKLYRTNGLVTANSRGITVTGQAQGQIDTDRNHAIRFGGR